MYPNIMANKEWVRQVNQIWSIVHDNSSSLSLSHWSSKALVSWEQCEMHIFSFLVMGRGLGTSPFIVERGDR